MQGPCDFLFLPIPRASNERKRQVANNYSESKLQKGTGPPLLLEYHQPFQTIRHPTKIVDISRHWADI